MAEGESQAQKLNIVEQHYVIYCMPSPVLNHNCMLHNICSSVMYNIMYSECCLSGLHF